ETLTRLLTELERWRALAGDLTREDVASALERQTLRPQQGDEPGRVAVVDLLRARTRRFDAVFVLGLEEGSLPRRGGGSPFLDDDARRALDARGARLERPDPVENDRYLFYTACTRASQRLYLVRQPARGEPVLARRPDGLGRRRRAPLDASAAALGADVAARGRADRAGAPAR